MNTKTVLNRQDIINCFTQAGVWLGTDQSEIDRYVKAVELAIEQDREVTMNFSKILPVPPWEERFKEMHPDANFEYYKPLEGDVVKMMKAELQDYRNLFTVGPMDFINLAGSVTQFQLNHLKALAFNMQPFGNEGLEQIIRAASVTGYVNGARDMKAD